MDRSILKNEIITEVKTDRLYRRLNKQSYSDGTCFYCVYKDKYNFCPVETMNKDLKVIIEWLEKEVNGRGKNMDNYTEDGKEIIKLLIDDGKDFIDRIKTL